jgi:hypothetical protein
MGKVTDISTRRTIPVKGMPKVEPIPNMMTTAMINGLADEALARIDGIMGGKIKDRDAMLTSQGVVQGIVMTCHAFGVLEYVTGAIQMRHDTHLDLSKLRIPRSEK